jgi:A/G-specific adenine glycosylase
MDEPALDGNLKRVYARLFDVSLPVDSTEGEAFLWNLARELLPKGKAADFNQALMDLGAMICLPKNPRCLICPVLKMCKARENGTQSVRPVKKQKKAIPRYTHVTAVVVRRIGNTPNAEVLLFQRPSKGLLGGMWEFPNARVNQDPGRELTKVIRSTYNLRLKMKRDIPPLAIVEHAYSHFKVVTHAFSCEILPGTSSHDLQWIPLGDLKNYPMGRIDRQISRVLVDAEA